MNRHRELLKKFAVIYVCCSMIFPPSLLMANPIDGTVVQGSATISEQGNTVTIDQSTTKSVINWQGFSIASGEKTVFNLPNSSSSVLNRVTGGDASAIYGTLQSNGNVYLVNPNGILIGPGAMINVNGLIASTLNITDDNFMQGGNLNFKGDSRSALINQGTIEALEGNIYLISASVENHGTLNAPNGTVGLGAGLDATIVDAAHPSLVVRATDQSLSNVGISNSGSINALQAELIANGSNAFALAINNTGTIRATGYEERGGRIFLVADGGSIQSSGELVAKRGENGGDIIAYTGGDEGTSVTLSGLVDVSGKDQGGTVYVKAANINIAQADIRLGGTIGGQLLLSVGPHTVNIFEGEAAGSYLKTDGTSTVVFARDSSDTNIIKITTIDGEGSLDAGGSGSNIVKGNQDDGFSGFVLESADSSNPYISNIEFNLDSAGNLPNEGDVGGSTVIFTVYTLEPDGTHTTNTFEMSYDQYLALQAKDGGDSSSSRVLLEAVNGELIEKITIESILLNDNGQPIDLDGNVITDGNTVNFLNQIKQINSVELVVEDPAILTIRKYVVGDQSQMFEFYLRDGDGHQNDDINTYIEMFELMHSGEINKILDPGTYTVDEVVPEGWFTSITASTDGENSTYNLDHQADGIAVVTLASGETVVLEYTNTEGGTIVVAKEVVGDQTQSFNFEILDGSNVKVGEGTLKNGESFESSPLMPGDYTIQELLGLLGTSGEWVTSIKVGDGEYITVSPDGSGNVDQVVTLGAGETITVTYKNVQQGQINVTKSVVATEENSGQTFKFELKDADGNVISTSFLGNNTGDLASGYIPPGEYSVEELLAMSNLIGTVPEEWKVVVTVKGETGPATTYTQGDLVELGAGEKLNFEFVNTQLGKVEITKITTGEGDLPETSFSFTIDKTGQDAPQGFQLAGGETKTFYLEQGNYDVSELLALLPPGWTLANLEALGTIAGQPDIEGGTVKVQIKDGEMANTVSLTFTNNFQRQGAPEPPLNPVFLKYVPIYPTGFGGGEARYAQNNNRNQTDELAGGSSFDLFGESTQVNSGDNP